MGGGALAVVYLVVLFSAVIAAGPAEPPRGAARRPVATAIALVVVAVPSLVQLTVAPGLLGALERDRGAVADGEVWRLVTSLVVQDGGWAGTAFNLAALAVVGAVAERAWGWRRWLVVALAAGVGAQLWGLVVQPVGGGTSVAVFGLAASLAVRSLRGGTGRERLAGLVSLVAAAVLLVIGDLHGGAAAIGAVCALLLAGSTGQRRRGPHPRGRRG